MRIKYGVDTKLRNYKTAKTKQRNYKVAKTKQRKYKTAPTTKQRNLVSHFFDQSTILKERNIFTFPQYSFTPNRKTDLLFLVKCVHFKN